MSLIIKGMEMPKHAGVNGEKDTAYKCLILAHPDNSVELVIDTKFASQYDNGHNIQRYLLKEIPTLHGRLIDADKLYDIIEKQYQFSSGKEHIIYRDILDLICSAETVIEAEAMKE